MTEIDTDAVRRDRYSTTAGMVLALCDEVDRLRAALREFVDEAVNGDHFCGGVPSEWTDRLRAALGDQEAQEGR